MTRQRFVVSLGSNVGESAAMLADAVARLRAASGVEVTGVSSLYRTAPVGGVEQPDFLNAVVLGETTRTPAELLSLCHELEQAHGRTREVRWGPRTLDVDVIAYGELVSDDPILTLPHPRAHERAFVLVPWLELDADARLPQGAVRDLVSGLGAQRIAAEPWPAAAWHD